MPRMKEKIKIRHILILMSFIIAFLFFASLNLIELEDVIKGKASLNTGDSFEFSTGKIYSNNLSNEIQEGDVFLSGFDYMPPYSNRSFGPPERSYYLHKINALGLHDAGTDASIECENVVYDKEKILILQGGRQFETNRTVCVKTKEDLIAKMIFQAPGLFEWELHSKRLQFAKGNVEALLSENAWVEDKILEGFQKGNEFVPVTVILKESPKYGIENLNLRKSEVDRDLSHFLSTISKDEFKLKYKYYFIFPGLAGEISKEGLEKIRTYTNVKAIYFDSKFKPTLSESAPLIRADEVWNIQIQDVNITGKDVGVCVVDSGINDSHPDLKDRIIAQHCFCSANCCPNGESEDDEDASDYDGHGTYVSGIVAASGSIKGIAPGAKIVAVKTYNKTSGDETDAQKGIDWCISNRDVYNISIIVLSIVKTDDYYNEIIYTEACDDADSIVIAANNATNYGIFTVAGAGNSGSHSGIGSPACGTNVSSVGAVFDYYSAQHYWALNATDNCTDTPTNIDYICCGSNRAPILDILAPGSLINSTWLQEHLSFYGTSASAPHIAGAAAILIQYEKIKNNHTLTAGEINDRFKDTGKLIIDSGQNSSNGGTNLTFSRIDIYSALFPIDVYDFKRVEASNTHNVFFFKIKNNYNNQTKNVNWSLDIGDGTVFTNNDSITLSPKKDIFVFFEHNYSDGDIYNLNATASSGEDSDSELMTLTLGDIIARDLREIYANGKEKVFMFRILNNMNSTREVNWTFHTGEQVDSSDELIALAPWNETFVFFHYNYTSGGNFIVNATAFNWSIEDNTRNLVLNVPG